MNKRKQQARQTDDAHDIAPSSYVHLGGRKWVRRIARAMASLLVLQSALSVLPAYAQITASPSAPAGQRPILDAARNGVPIVHIAPPSKAGVSHIQYDQFNVNQNGLILNNSPTSVLTQQGGWITGNLQLGPTPARIILNEVVGVNPSQLRGTIEVAGQRAGIVVANPNGIICDGCGFLNADRASLTTGRPQFGSDGSIQGFDVRQGQLTVGGNGLNATNIEQLDLIARGIVIEGEVWAKSLNAIAGANQVLYGTLQAAAQAGAGTAPRFAIDIKDLGGMYANQVYLMSTEQGVGVNSTGRTAALQGNLVLSANGDLSLQHSYAKQDIRIDSTGNVRLAGVTQSNGTTSVVASGTLDNSGGSLLAGGDASLQAGAIVNKAGSIASKIAAGGNVEIQGGSLNNDKSSIVAGGNVTLALAAGALSNNQGTIGAGGALAVNAGGLDNTAGQIVSSGDVRINSARFNNNSGITASTAGKLDIDTHGQELNNDRGLLQAAGNVAIATRGHTLVNTNSGSNGGIVAGGALTVAAGSLDNRAGFVASNGSQSIAVSGDVDNSQAGQIVSNADSTITAANVLNSGGSIDTLGKLAVSTSLLDNRAGKILAGGESALNIVTLENGAAGAIDADNVTATAKTINNAGGAIRAANNANLNADTLDNSAGTLTAKSNLSVTAASLANSGGRLVADKEVTVTTSSESPDGTIASANNVTLTVNGNYSNNTLLSAQGNLTVSASNIANSGTLTAGKTLTASTGNLSNSGEISGETVLLNASGTLSNSATGLIDGVDTRINAGTINNTGRIYGDWLRIGGGTLNNSGSGTIAARDTLLIGVQNLNNTNGGLIYSIGDIGMAGGIDASGQLQGSMQSLVNASSKIEAGRNLSINAASILNRNDSLVTTRVPEAPVNEDRVQPTNTSMQFPASQCYGIGGGQDDNGCKVHPDKYGTRSTILPVRSEVCAGSWDSPSCSMQPNYQWNSPIFAQYQVAPVGPPPAEPAGGCTAPSGDSGDLPVNSWECNKWRTDYAAWDAGFQNTLDQLAPKVDAYNAEVNEDNRIHHFEDYTWFQVTSTKSHTAVVSSAPGKILAGGSISLTGAVTNRDSEIVAGSALTISGPAPVNYATKGEDRIDYSGTTQFTKVDSCGTFGDDHCRNWGPTNPYSQAPYAVPTDLHVWRYESYAANPTALRNLAVATAGADSSVAAGIVPAAGNSLGSVGQVAPIALTIPQNSLFTLDIDSKAPYLVKADPRFTNYRDFISSDYFLQALNRDPERQLKRYGDGFTEQHLINDQILALTGRRYLSGYTSTEAEYKALMDAGVAFGRQYQLTPGVSLTAGQMALLTTDIVWLVTRTVTLPDGSAQQVLAPQVYLRRPSGQDLQPTGALMAANDVLIRTEGDLVNSGTISGDRVTALAGGDVINQGGRISGQDIRMRANNDLKNLSGVIAGVGADSSVTLLAGRDIVLQTQTGHTVNDDGTSTRTNIQRIATVQGGNVRLDAGRDLVALGAGVHAEKDLVATAARDITVAAVAGEYQLNVKDRSGARVQGRTGYIQEAATSNQLANLTAGNNAVLAATGDVTLKGADISAGTAGTGDALIQGRNVNIESATDRVASDIQMTGANSYTRFAREDEALAGGSIAAANNVRIRATGTPGSETDKDGKPLAKNSGGDITVTGAYLSSENGQVTLAANNDIAIRNGATRHIAIDESYSKSGNLLQKVATTKSDSTAVTQVEGSAISGNTVALKAGNDLAVRGSSIVGSGDVMLTAESGNVEIAAAQSSSTESHYRHEKRSGISASGVGIGITIGTSEKKSNFDGAATTESESRSAVGSTGGNLIITAGKDTTIKGSDLIAGKAEGDTQGTTGHIDIQAQNIIIEPGKDTSRTKATLETRQSGVTVALVGTPLDTARNLKDVQKNPSKFGRVRGTLDEIANSSMTTPQVAVNFDRSKSSNQVTTNDHVNSGSSLTAAGDIRLRATGNGAKDGAGKATDGDITVSGSFIKAGGTTMLDAERNITLQASTDHYQESSQATSSSTHFSTAIPSLGDLGRAISGGPNNSGVGGFPYGKANSSDTGESAASTQTATLVSGNNVVLNSRSGDIRIAGSGVDAVEDIGVVAKQGRIDISSGQDSRRRQEERSSHAVGDLGSNAKDGSMGTGFTVGVKSEHSTLDTTQTQQSTIRGQLTAGGNITLDAKEDITATGIDLRAGRDLTAIGENVYLDPGQDTVHTLQSSEMSQVGVTVSTSGYAVEAAKALEQAAKAVEQKDDKRLAALYGTKAALTVYNGMGAPSGPSAANPQSQAIVKVTASIGSSSAESTSENAATQNMGSTLTAGGTVTVIATGSGEKDAAGKAVNGDISARGTLISGTNVELIAARDINLQSAKDTTHDRSSDSSRNASIGVGFALGGQQNGFTLEMAAAKAEGNANGDSITHRNTIVTASDTLIVNSGRDTNLNGAQVRGETVIANIGRDLNIASQQDADTYHSKQDSAGFSASVCIPPFCYGTTVEASANVAKANTDSTYQSVKEQSGLYAGKGGFDVTVKGNTDLKGGVLASDAEASKNRLVTGTLTTSDIENKAEYKSDSSSVSLSYSGGSSNPNGTTTAPGGIKPDGTSASGTALQTIGSNLASNAASNAISAKEGTTGGTTKSGISAGTIVITDEEGQVAKTGKTADETIASVSRDTGTANGSIQKIFDLKKLQREQEYQKVLSEVAQQAAPIVYKQVGDRLDGQPTEVKVAVHALVGGLMSKAIGGEFGSGAAGAAAATLAVETFGKEIRKIPGLSKEDQDALIMLTGQAVGTVVAAAAGASTSSSNAAGATAKLATQHNYLAHWQKEAYDKEIAACLGGTACQAKVHLKYLAVNISQDARMLSGMGLGAVLEANELAVAILEIPKAAGAILDNPAILKALPAGYVHEIETAYNNYLTALETAGPDGATAAGVYFIKLANLTVPILAAGGEAAATLSKSTINLLGKASRARGSAFSGAKGVGEAGKLIGSIDNLSVAEQGFVRETVAGGKTIEVIPATNAGRTADFIIDGTKYELKTMSKVANQSSDGLSKALSSTIMDARGQSGNIIIDARGQVGMTAEIAERGIARAFGRDAQSGSKIQGVTVITREGPIYIPRNP